MYPEKTLPNYPRGVRTQNILRNARHASGLTLRALGARAGTSHTTLSAYENGSKIPKLDTFMRILHACDQAVDFELHPRIRSANGIPRGEELEQVLELAEQFPSNPMNNLNYPAIKKRA